MEEPWQPRDDGKYDPLRCDVVETVLVPARQFPPATMRPRRLCLDDVGLPVRRILAINVLPLPFWIQ
jgi:hypothetical protein